MSTDRKKARCKDCGYTKEDAGIHMDHHLCKNDGNAPWQRRQAVTDRRETETNRKPKCSDCVWHECADKVGGCGCACHVEVGETVTPPQTPKCICTGGFVGCPVHQYVEVERVVTPQPQPEGEIRGLPEDFWQQSPEMQRGWLWKRCVTLQQLSDLSGEATMNLLHKKGSKHDGQ